MPGLEIVGAGTQVPLATGGEIEYANLDHAASAPALQVVAEAVDRPVQHYASVHRGAGFHSQLSTALYEGAREPVREFVGARDSDALIFTRNTTDAFNLLAHCLPVGTTVVVFETEHHATLLPWEQHRVIRLPAPASPEAAVRAVADTCRDQRKKRSGTGRRDRRLQRHRRDLAGRQAGCRRSRPRRPDRAGCGAAGPAPAVLDRGPVGRLRRDLRVTRCTRRTAPAR